MKRSLRRTPIFGVLAALALFAAFAGAACSDDSGGNANGDVVNGINILDKAGLHDLDTAISTNKTIAANATTTYQQLQTVTLLTEWPNKDLKDKAKALAAIFGEAAAATAGDKPDVTKAGEAAHNAHEGEHDFSHAVWEYLYDKAGISGGDDHDDD